MCFQNPCLHVRSFYPPPYTVIVAYDLSQQHVKLQPGFWSRPKRLMYAPLWSFRFFAPGSQAFSFSFFLELFMRPIRQGNPPTTRHALVALEAIGAYGAKVFSKHS